MKRYIAALFARPCGASAVSVHGLLINNLHRAGRTRVAEQREGCRRSRKEGVLPQGLGEKEAGSGEEVREAGGRGQAREVRAKTAQALLSQRSQEDAFQIAVGCALAGRCHLLGWSGWARQHHARGPAIARLATSIAISMNRTMYCEERACIAEPKWSPTASCSGVKGAIARRVIVAARTAQHKPGLNITALAHHLPPTQPPDNEGSLTAQM